MQRLVAELLHRPAGLRLGQDLAPASLQAVARYRCHDSTVTALDGTLAPSRSRQIEVPPGARLLTATPGLETVVLATPDALVIVADTGVHRLAIASADSAALLQSGRLLVTAPVVLPTTRQGQPYESGHRVLLLDPDAGRRVDEVVVDVDDTGVIAVAHPHDGSVLLDAGEGQDGSRVFVARAEGDELAVDLVLENVVAAGFSPLGDRLLVTPHPSFDGPVSVLAWPGLQRIATTGPADPAGVDDGFDLYGCFLGDRRILLKTFEHGLVLYSADLRPAAWIDLTSSYPSDDIQIETVLGTTKDAFAAELWIDGGAVATVWRIPAAASPDPPPLQVAACIHRPLSWVTGR